MFLIFVLLLSGRDRNYLHPHLLLYVTVAVTEHTGLCNSGKAHGQTFCTLRSRFWGGQRGRGELRISPLYGISFCSSTSFTLSSSYAIQHYAIIIETLQRKESLCMCVCVRARAIGHVKLFIKIRFMYEGESGKGKLRHRFLTFPN